MPTNGMTIDSLNTVSSLTAQDEVPVWDKEASSEPTKKITGSNLASSVKTLGSLLDTSNVVNNLTSSATDKPLSANMGRVLNDKIAIITGTSGESISDSVLLNYPSGFSGDNAVLIGLQYYDKNIWRTLGALNASEPCVITATLQETGINVVVRASAGTGKNVKITLYRQ